MTVNELLAKLAAAFPAFNAQATEAWAVAYRSRLAKHEGPALAKAYADTLGGFSVKSSKSLFPMPADFEAHLPSGKINLGKDSGPVLDLTGRKRRADSLYANWQQGQCRRADKGNPLLRRSLENIARQVADVMGWKENPEPLVLTHAQLKTACQSALSIERRQRYGQPPKDKHVWWQQLFSIASEWGVQITPDWWDKSTGEAFAAKADEPSAPPKVPANTATPGSLYVPSSPPNPAAHLSLLKSRIKFFTDMGMVDYVAQMQRELADLERDAA